MEKAATGPFLSSISKETPACIPCAAGKPCVDMIYWTKAAQRQVEFGVVKMKKAFASRSSRILLALFLPTMAAYIVIFAAAFSELPLGIGPVHQFLLLFFHFIPMFFLEILLCRLAHPFWRVLVPVLLLAVPVFIFAAVGEFYVMAWILAGFWCIAPAAGSILACLVWYISHQLISFGMGQKREKS